VILADTSIWINHLHTADERLTALLEAGEVLGHPFVMGELALGRMRGRQAVLLALYRLPQAMVADNEHVLTLIERHALYGRGIGYIDAHLLAAVRLTPEAQLWTADQPLQAIAVEFGIAANLWH
jgi:predicted nucleic acid-binding protein